jgi:DNA mismatch endonuclease (patch repair protein)
MDVLTEEQRHYTMRRIRSKDTKPEVKLRHELWHRGIRYRKNLRTLPGTPDIVLTKYKIAVFCDGEYFHGKNWQNGEREHVMRGDHADFWAPKIEHNIKHDKEVNAKLRKDGWKVLRFWSKDVMKDVSNCADKVEETVKEVNPEYVLTKDRPDGYVSLDSSSIPESSPDSAQ